MANTVPRKNTAHLRSALAWAIGVLVLASCAPAPRNVACSNDGQCTQASGELHYCLESRCVECVGNSACGNGKACIDGACAPGQ
jgi:hypothetical protein